MDLEEAQDLLQNAARDFRERERAQAEKQALLKQHKSQKQREREAEEQRKAAWIEYHERQIESHRKTRDGLIAKHEAALARLQRGA